MRKSKANIFIHIPVIIFAILCILPLIVILTISVSDEAYIVANGYSIFPKDISFSAYKYIFANPGDILSAYRITIMVTVIGLVTSLLICSGLGYVLSRKDFAWSRQLTFFVFFTMLFNGGMVPTYMVVTKLLKISDTILAMIIPLLVSAWNVMLLKSFFKGLPDSLIEAARIDGASEIGIFFKIAIPLAKPALATVGTFIALGYWNDWYQSLLYINKKELVNLQFMLYKMMSNIQEMLDQMENLPSGVDVNSIPNESARMAMCILAAGPMMFVFPFFQKYFVKGMTVGAVKG